MKKILAMSTLWLATACNVTNRLESESAPKVVYGSLVPQGKLTSAVQISPSCGGVKVAETLYLTAAHCVVGLGAFGGGISLPQAGESLTLRTGNDANKEIFNVTLISVSVFPPYLEALTNQGASVIQQPSAQNPSDIALIKVEETIPQIGISPIHFETINPGTEVIFAGFGSETLSGGSSFDSPFKYFEAAVNEIDGNYLIIKANGSRIQQTGTAGRGDSGGPLFLQVPDDPTPPVIGINSFRGFIEIDGSRGIQIGLSRLDELAIGNPKSWIEESMRDIDID